MGCYGRCAGCYGAAVGLLWGCCGVPVGLLWGCYGGCVGPLSLLGSASCGCPPSSTVPGAVGAARCPPSTVPGGVRRSPRAEPGASSPLSSSSPQDAVLNACYRGCRLFSICHFVDASAELNTTRAECEAACAEAYGNAEEQFGCVTGCRKQLPEVEESRKEKVRGRRWGTPSLHRSSAQPRLCLGMGTSQMCSLSIPDPSLPIDIPTSLTLTSILDLRSS
uniref:Transmembrane protein 59 n=1 Tax=Malurus cyaneus samueli TaxID=2593467 RepID=A0A8C5X7Y8_9PASS